MKKQLNIDSTVTRLISPIQTDKYDDELITKTRSIIKDQKINTGLISVYDATHTGYLNHNNKVYDSKSVKSKDYKTFYTPYPKPHVISHYDDVIPVGRIHAAKWVQVPNSSWDGVDMEGVLKTATFFPGIAANQNYIDMITSGNLITVSSGFYAGNATCSICGIDRANKDRREECIHIPGETYDGKKAYLKMSNLEYFHLAFSTEPAHSYAVNTSNFEVNGDSIVEMTKAIYNNKSVLGAQYDTVIESVDLDNIAISGINPRESAVRIYEIDNRTKIFVPNTFQIEDQRRTTDMEITPEALSKMVDDVVRKSIENLDATKKQKEATTIAATELDAVKKENVELTAKLDEVKEVAKTLTASLDAIEKEYKATIKENIVLSAKLIDKQIDEKLVSSFDNKTAKELLVVKEVLLDGKTVEDIIKTIDEKQPTGSVEPENKEQPNVNNDDKTADKTKSAKNTDGVIEPKSFTENLYE